MNKGLQKFHTSFKQKESSMHQFEENLGRPITPMHHAEVRIKKGIFGKTVAEGSAGLLKAP